MSDIQGRTARVLQDWSQRGEHWDRHADALAEIAERFNQPLMQACGIAPGQQVLDCATGAGEPALSVAEAIGQSGHLTATDLVAAMIAGAERRARARNIANISFKVSDMTALPFDDETFDRVICRFGLMFVPGPERAAREACRVLKPGGRAAYMVWGPIAENTAFSVVKEACEQVFGRGDPLIELEAPFQLAADGALRAALEAGGFAETSVETRTFAPRLPADRPFWGPQLDMTVGRRLDAATPEERAALEAAVGDGYARFIKDDAYHLSAVVKIGVGIKAA